MCSTYHKSSCYASEIRARGGCQFQLQSFSLLPWVGFVLTVMRHKRSPSHLKRDRFRKRQWLERRSAQHEVVPCDRIWLLDRLCKAGEKLPGSFSAFMRKWRLLPTGACSRQRDIFPLPELSSLVLTSFGLPRWKAKIMLAFVNLVVLALNFLYGAGGQVQLPVKLTAAQSDVATRVASSCMDFYTRLQKAEDGLWEHLLPDWFAGVSKSEGLKYTSSWLSNSSVVARLAWQTASQAAVPF